MGSDNPPPPAGRLKARKKAQVIRALVVIAAVALLVYLTQDPVDPHKGVPHATGTAPGSGKPPFPKAAAKGASIDAGGEFKIPIRTFTRHDSSRHRENDQMTLGIRPPVKRDRVGEERPREIPKSPPLTPKQTFHGLYDLSAVDIKGVPQLLQQFGGSVVLVVNVASACGYTEANYDGLRDLYNKYHPRGLTVLAFPCNQFGQQEPGSNEEVEIFAHKKGAQFPLFSKVDVNGDSAHEVYRYLKKHLPGDISWNFNKFLVDRAGNPVKRYGPQFDKDEIEKDIERYLLTKQ